MTAGELLRTEQCELDYGRGPGLLSKWHNTRAFKEMNTT